MTPNENVTVKIISFADRNQFLMRESGNILERHYQIFQAHTLIHNTSNRLGFHAYSDKFLLRPNVVPSI